MDFIRILFLVILIICLCPSIFCACRPDQWRCASGDCLQQTQVCDGLRDCQDGSDETFQYCSRPEFSCPKESFRCSYGACTSQNNVCDGIDDCNDRSDELQQHCPGVELRPGTHSCSDSQFPCVIGDQCIDIFKLCDGKADCDDSSDETILQCSQKQCNSTQFRCSYGACISDKNPCDGTAQCFDGSDELAPQCKPLNTASYSKPADRPQIATSSTTTSTTTARSTGWHEGSSHSSRYDCILPEYPENGFYDVLTDNAQRRPGSHVSVKTAIRYACDKGYRVVTKKGKHTFALCENGKWSNRAPICTDECEELNSDKFRLECLDGRKRTISCRGKLPANTSVTFRCGPNYRSVTRLNYDTIYCRNGVWDPPLSDSVCDIVCGRTSGYLQAFIGTGKEAEPLRFPWHVGIYEYIPDQQKWEQTCAGTLVKPQVVITAAHCFIEKELPGGVLVKNSSYIQVGLGKTHRDLNADEEFSQIFTIKKIVMHPNFGGQRDKLSDDIAIIIIKGKARYAQGVTPVCIVLDDTDEEDTLVAGPAGEVAGWGQVNETTPSSEKLRYAKIPLRRRTECKQTIGNTLRPFITNDKMCGIDQATFQTACKGDSGGGYVFFDKTTGQFTLRGIVSGGDRQCSGQEPVLFTKVSYHAEFIRNEFRKLGLE